MYNLLMKNDIFMYILCSIEWKIRWSIKKWDNLIQIIVDHL